MRGGGRGAMRGAVAMRGMRGGAVARGGGAIARGGGRGAMRGVQAQRGGRGAMRGGAMATRG